MTDAPILETRSGRVRGLREDGLEIFRGIPYAAPPRGGLRWRAPQEPEPWARVRDATRFGPAALQRAGFAARLLGGDLGPCDEDCLTLTAWTPGRDAGGRPVLVWIHGGGFTAGASSWPVFDAAALARRGDVVVVGINYRLGALGFLAWPETGADSANFGLLDQIAALRWVREHAFALGGDPERVTVFGNSAGAMSIGALLAAPDARGLFQRAILQSGAARNVHEPNAALRVARCFARELGGEPGAVDVLRARPGDDVLDAQLRTAAALRREMDALVFQPAVDGRVLPRAPRQAIREAAVPAVPLLIGTNLEEWKFYQLADPRARQLDLPGLRRRCARILPGAGPDGQALSEHVIRVYREERASRGEPIEPADLWSAIETDRWFRAPACELASQHAGPVWSYLFTWRSPALGDAVGCCHSLEVPFVFGLENELGRRIAGEDAGAFALSRRMQEAWLAFAREGSPRTAALPDWETYNRSSRRTQVLGRECGVVGAPAEPERAFWEGVSRGGGVRQERAGESVPREALIS